MRHYFFLVVLFFGFIQCKQSENNSNSALHPKNSIENASGFSLHQYDGFSVITVTNAYPEAQENYRYVLHKKGVQIPDSLKQFTAIEVPIQKIIVTSTTHIPSLEMLGVLETLVAFPNINYVSSEKTRNRIDSGKIREIGSNQSLNTEVILDVAPDIIVGFSVDGDMKTYRNLEKNGQTILFNSDWTEKHPLGKAEWIKFFGALYDLDEKAATIFNTIKKDYESAKALVSKTTAKPTIFAGAVYKDQWFLPQGDSWAAFFLNEAQGNYLWKESKGTGSLALSFETVLDQAQDADFWIGPGQFTSIDEVLNANPNYQYFKAVKNKNIYSFSTKKGKTGGVIYYELAPNRPDLVIKDLIKILHPEVLPDYELFFFEKLK